MIQGLPSIMVMVVIGNVFKTKQFFHSVPPYRVKSIQMSIPTKGSTSKSAKPTDKGFDLVRKAICPV